MSGALDSVEEHERLEADVVCVVLGGVPGAKRFAVRKPNLENVAITRARRRLYVVGDWSDWCEQPFVAELAAALPRWSP